MAKSPQTNLSFSAQIKAFRDKTVDKLELVFKESVQRVIALMQEPGPSKARGGPGGPGKLPVDLGFLRASLVATLNSPTTGIQVPSSDVGVYAYNEGSVQLIILAAKLGDSVYAVYTAAYARRIEYGFVGVDSLGREYNQDGYGFVRLAASQWQNVVSEVAAEAARR